MTAEHFDAVVVGSGFGGSVTAYRLAEAGQRVCVLERGKAYPPGSFPRSPYRMRTNFWDPSAGLHGLFDVWAFPGISALVSSGLGGGSLIYANVLLRKDERWFVTEDISSGGYEHWPVTRADLDPHYDRVQAMLRPREYPYPEDTPKTKAFRAAARDRGLDWFLPPLAVTFAPDDDRPPIPGEPIAEEHPNLHGRTRYTCRLVGECDFGCNYGSKNSLDYTYLSAAQRLGADIRVLSEVRAFEPRSGGGYAVQYVQHHPAEDGEPAGSRNGSRALPLTTLTADKLILAAGTLGTTFLLLKNRSAFPRLSRRIGHGFGGNGDLLTFAVRKDAGAPASGPDVIDPSYGPVITSAIRVKDAVDGGEGRGYYVEDAGFPDFLTWVLQVFETPGVLWRFRTTARALALGWLRGEPDTNTGAELSKLFSKTDLSAGALPLLGMGRDIPDGRMSLRRGKLTLDWRLGKSGPFFDRLRGTCRSLTGPLGARFVDNPMWLLKRVITVHPLGGCRMGRTIDEGVVDPHGQVFEYPNLYIADGSVMPGPVGANPSFTIAALADRFADRLTS
jgi:cholesterol oxidase